jgi:hypothetical protein
MARFSKAPVGLVLDLVGVG